MGRVYLAADPEGRQAAVKVVRSDLAEVPAFLKRFARELDVAQRVHGPHIAEIYDSQSSGPRPWLATEYVPGPTLQEAIERGGCFGSARLRAFASAVADALKTIHAADVVHRDLKPSNILLGADGPKVIDFGVARAIDASLLTNTGQTLGTPAYMSPEQADGRMVQSASDVFALGALLVFAATGRLAFGDGPALAILHRVVNNEPDLEGVADDDPELHELIAKCLAKEPDDRPTPQQLIDALGEIRWEPLTGVEWTQPPMGIGLPLTVSDAADAPTVAISPKGRSGKRIAVISTAAVAALILAAIALVEGTGDKGTPSAKGSAKVGESLSGASSGGSFPSGGDGTDGSSGPSGNTSSSSGGGTPSASGTPNSQGSPVSPGGPPAPDAPTSGVSTSGDTAQNPVGQPTTSQGQAPHTTASSPAAPKTTAPASKTTTSKPAPPPTSSAAPPPANHPPAPYVHGEVGVYIPPWFGMATVQVSWTARSDASGYELHYTVDNSTDQTIPVNGTSYSYQISATSTSCVQVRPVNQYGKADWYPSPMYCFTAGGNTVSGSL